MKKSLKILITASEMSPYAKVGGLGDVSASLSAALQKLGHDVRVVIPRYRCIDLQKCTARIALKSMGVWMGDRQEWCMVYQTMSGGKVPVYFVEHSLFFDRDGLYHDQNMHDYDDNPLRFAFFSRAALQLCKDIGFKPDVVHCNDWQTALVSAYLKVWHWNDPLLGSAASLLTIHNAAYQGIYPKSNYDYIGLGWQNFTENIFESYDKVNFLKGGIHFADMVTAVSPAFANEIRGPGGGFGLAPYLNDKGEKVRGILNGIDYEEWNPQTDTFLPVNYSANELEGKKKCKRHLQKLFCLKKDPKVALIGTVGRFVHQKGFHLVRNIIEGVLDNMHVQFVILGSGESDLQEFFHHLPARYSGKAGSYIGFDNERAHLIEAGCDFFLMPSLFEPCGLNQMYSLRYGTLPIVRATGGLDDTVENYNEYTGSGNGFKFGESSESALYYTIGWAVSTYYDRPEHIKKMILDGMKRDFSWETSAKKYVDAYRAAIENKKEIDSYKPYYR
ncbi:MAG: glycogen synthase [Chitinispirillales bacterium]|jgi:starch synthase|nr:glycogen synthase [Chitinispirillales bacterium]